MKLYMPLLPSTFMHFFHMSLHSPILYSVACLVYRLLRLDFPVMMYPERKSLSLWPDITGIGDVSVIA